MKKYTLRQLKLAIVLDEVMMEAAQAEDWDRYNILREHIEERSPTQLLSIARQLIKDDQTD